MSSTFVDQDVIKNLTGGPILWFADWPVDAVPKSGGGVYTIWDREEKFVYVGMSGRSADVRGSGPWGRLNSHASGRRNGDQFCVYVCDRLVLPILHNRLHGVAAGYLRLDGETKGYIPSQLGFRYLAVRSPREAREIEAAFQRGDAVGKPLLNPR